VFESPVELDSPEEFDNAAELESPEELDRPADPLNPVLDIAVFCDGYGLAP
jgi:hypothetical protein